MILAHGHPYSSSIELAHQPCYFSSLGNILVSLEPYIHVFHILTITPRLIVFESHKFTLQSLSN